MSATFGKTANAERYHTSASIHRNLSFPLLAATTALCQAIDYPPNPHCVSFALSFTGLLFNKQCLMSSVFLTTKKLLPHLFTDGFCKYDQISLGRYGWGVWGVWGVILCQSDSPKHHFLNSSLNMWMYNWVIRIYLYLYYLYLYYLYLYYYIFASS